MPLASPEAADAGAPDGAADPETLLEEEFALSFPLADADDVDGPGDAEDDADADGPASPAVDAAAVWEREGSAAVEAEAVAAAAVAAVDTMDARRSPRLMAAGLALRPATLMPAWAPVPTLALCPGLTSAICPVARLVTPTRPRSTATSAFTPVT